MIYPYLHVRTLKQFYPRQCFEFKWPKLVEASWSKILRICWFGRVFWKLKCLKYFARNNRVQFPDGHDLDESNKDLKLGGGNSNIFYVHPLFLGKMIPNLTYAYFSGWVGWNHQPAVRLAVGLTRMPRATRSRLDWSRLRPGTGRGPIGPSPACLPGRKSMCCCDIGILAPQIKSEKFL